MAFEQWVRANNKQDVYGDVTSLYDEAYAGLNKVGLYSVYLQDGISNSVPMSVAMSMKGLSAALKDADATKGKTMASSMLSGVTEMYHEYNVAIEKQVLAVVFKHIIEDLDPTYLPAALTKLSQKHKRNFSEMANEVYENTMFTDTVKLKKFLANPKSKSLEKDPLFAITGGYLDMLTVTLKPILGDINDKLNRANRLYLSAQIEMEKDKVFAPDANGTMRLSYGIIESYKARDAVNYNYFTTAKGIAEKFIPGDFEFDAPEALINLIRKKDFGRYADADGELHTCFLSNNDITGGNSGSPVINGNGELIGTAFDGNWEAIASDFGFMPSVQRTISVDIRYTLFIVDKLGGATNIINELDLR
jgi:hypothetical protein